MEVVEKKSTNKPQIKVGDVFDTNCHGQIIIIYYNNANDIGVRFSDGHERSATSGNIQKGKVKNSNVPPLKNAGRKCLVDIVIGEKYKNKEGLSFTVESYSDSQNVSIVFDSGYSTTVSSQAIRLGSIKDYLSPTKMGVGILGVGKYCTDFRKGSESKEYSYWSSMLARCYNSDYKARFPTYQNATMCAEWLNFQVFAEWCNSQKNYSHEDFVLDKDILVKGNKHYSPSTCTIVHHKINSLFTKADSRRGNYPIGVYFATKNKKLGACLREDNKNVHLGFFDCAKEAFLAYKSAKEKYIKRMADTYRGSISEECYSALYSYQVEITD